MCERRHMVVYTILWPTDRFGRKVWKTLFAVIVKQLTVHLSSNQCSRRGSSASQSLHNTTEHPCLIRIIPALKAVTYTQSSKSDHSLQFNYHYCLAVSSLVRVQYLFQSAAGGLQLACLFCSFPPHSHTGNTRLRPCDHAEISWFLLCWSYM